MSPEIAAAIARGDFTTAGNLAAALPDPRDHMKAMVEINRALRAHKGVCPMLQQFSLDEKDATIVKYECDKRVSDDPTADAPAIAEVTFELNLPGELLAGFDPTLRACLFHKSGAVTHNLADQAHDAPDVRFPSVIYPIRLKEQWEGATVTIHKGIGGRSNLVLNDAAVTTFHVTPKNGGTFILEFTSRSKPESDGVFGALARMLKTKVSISLAPPAPPQDDVGPIQ